MTSVAHICPYMIGKFYLVGVRYGAKPPNLIFIPFCSVTYHLNEWGNNQIENEKNYSSIGIHP
jgi:hypothetical protein